MPPLRPFRAPGRKPSLFHRQRSMSAAEARFSYDKRDGLRRSSNSRSRSPWTATASVRAVPDSANAALHQLGSFCNWTASSD